MFFSESKGGVVARYPIGPFGVSVFVAFTAVNIHPRSRVLY